MNSPMWNNPSKKSNVKVLVRLMTRTGGAFSDVGPEKDVGGIGDPRIFFSTVKSDNIVKVENEPVECK